MRRFSGGVDAGALAVAGRPADDSAIDQRHAAAVQAHLDGLHGLRGNGVAVGQHGRRAGRPRRGPDIGGHASRTRRHQDRQDQIAALDERG